MSARTRSGAPPSSLLAMLTAAVDEEMRDLWRQLRTTSALYE